MISHKRNQKKDRLVWWLSYPTTFTCTSNALPPDQALIWKLKIPTADLNIDFMLIKTCVEMLVNYKIALVLQACRVSHMLYYFLFQRVQKPLTTYRRCPAGCRIWPLLNKLRPELIAFPITGGTFSTTKMCTWKIFKDVNNNPTEFEMFCSVSPKRNKYNDNILPFTYWVALAVFASTNSLNRCCSNHHLSATQTDFERTKEDFPLVSHSVLVFLKLNLIK